MNTQNQEQTLPYVSTTQRQHCGTPQHPHPAPSYRTGAAIEEQQTNLLSSFRQLMCSNTVPRGSPQQWGSRSTVAPSFTDEISGGRAEGKIPGWLSVLRLHRERA